MMKSAALMFIALMIIAATLGFFCSLCIIHNKKADNVPIDDGAYGTCVVTSAPIEREKAVEITYDGKKYVLCCVACKSVFEKNPEKFIQGRKASGINVDAQGYPKLLYKSKF